MNNRSDFRSRVKRDYWNKYKDRKPEDIERWNTYISEFLPCELEFARADGSRLPSPSREILILMMGYSLEPLLQSVCAWRPKKVILVRNQSIEESWANLLVELIAQLSPSILETAPCTDEEIVLPGDLPEEVFRCFREKLLGLLKTHSRDQIVLDITGGKKSMVAGAYLFGAYADLAISYVDFDVDVYDREFNRPYGDTCRIDILKNPYTLFGLRDWQQVEELYSHYAFQNACALVKQLQVQMSDLFQPKDIESADRLAHVLEIYEAWDNGDFQKAYSLHNSCKKDLKSDLQMPTAVETLGSGENWLKAGIGAQKEIEKFEYNLYQNTRNLVVYAWDELGKARRLLKNNEDNRSALLRSMGLAEFLLRTRVLGLIQKDRMEWCLSDSDMSGQELSYKPWRCAPEALKEVVEDRVHKEVYLFIRALRYREKEPKYRTELKIDGSKFQVNKNDREENEKLEVYIRRTLDDTPLISKEALPGNEKDLRNKAIHSYFSPTKDMAERALKIAQASLDDFVENWVRFLGADNPSSVQTEIVSWIKLCEVCDIEFLPPQHGKGD